MIVLCFHRISDEHSPAYPPIPTKVFDNICRHLKKNYTIIHPNNLFTDQPTPKPKALITFDDAYTDFLQEALPILEKYEIPVIQHIITDCADTGTSFWTQKLNKIIEAYFHEGKAILMEPLNFNVQVLKEKELENIALSLFRKLLEVEFQKREEIIIQLESNLSRRVEYTSMLAWDDLRKLNESDLIEFGSHTCSHKNLATLSDEDAHFEMYSSKEKIERKLGVDKKLFLAYPNGQYNERIGSIAQEIGYKAAFTTNDGKFSGDNKFEIPRILVYHTSWWKNWVYLKLKNL